MRTLAKHFAILFRRDRLLVAAVLAAMLAVVLYAADLLPVDVGPPRSNPLAPLPPIVPANNGEIRMVNWNIRRFPAGRPEPQPEAAEIITLRSAAKTIRAIEPTILCAEEIRNADIAEKFAEATKLPGFRLAVCSDFTLYDGSPCLQQVAIFSTYPVLRTAAERWHTVGAIDPPRGYAFALLDAPGGPVGVFAIHLKSNYIAPEAEDPEKQATINKLKRQFASQQLRETVRAMRADGRLPPKARVIVAGDFNTSEHGRWPGETTLSAFRKEGWHSCYEGLPPSHCHTVAADPVFGYDAVTFDYIFTQGFASRRATQIRPVRPQLSDHAIVVQLLR